MTVPELSFSNAAPRIDSILSLLFQGTCEAGPRIREAAYVIARKNPTLDLIVPGSGIPITWSLAARELVMRPAVDSFIARAMDSRSATRAARQQRRRHSAAMSGQSA
ncbi:hypothetical protein BN2476_500023 [Paraburkholderia piptadeniae]|uniref:Uncharacterized protein n=1 Tax=Paraburkholderia piptadeniae TaxID=1701573 RepID=A0A1N7SFB2_9BURK|nr:hypothetical protein BN2476_500023 [Paraburkholderia piptadeniae]